MKAEDTVMSKEEATKLLLIEAEKFHKTFNPRTGQIEDVHLPILEDTILIGAKAQAEISFKAGIREFGLQLRGRIGGIDEFVDWSDEGLRQFRKMVISTVRDTLKEWGIE